MGHYFRREFKFNKMLKLLVFVAISAKLMAFAWASDQEVACTQQTTAAYYDKLVASLLENLYSNTCDATAEERFLRSNNLLMAMCLYNQIRTVGNDNIMSSIYPLEFHFAQMAPFADESTLAQYLRLMNLNSIDEMDQVVSKYVNYFKSDIAQHYTSEIDYLILIDNSQQCTDDFKNKFSSTFGGEIVNTDFQDFSATSDYLNNWMKQESSNQDYDFLSSVHSLDPSSLIIATWNHVKVYWDKSFKPSETESMVFHGSDGNDVTIDAINFEGVAGYYYDEVLNCEFMELPLKGGFKIRLIFPKDQNKMEEIIFYMRSKYTEIFELLKSVSLKLTAPNKSDFYGAEDYVPGLKQVNMLTKTFLPSTNVFSSGFETEPAPYISHMFNKMHLTIEDLQEDTETDSEVTDCSELPSQTVTLNSPYIGELMCWDGSRVMSYVLQKIPN